MQNATYETIVDEIMRWKNMSLAPDSSEYPKYKDNDVIDENKSVKWNREEIERRNQAYAQEKIWKRTEYSNQARKIDSMIIDYIFKYIEEFGLSEESAKIIYNRVYQDNHSVGYIEVLNAADYEVEYIAAILNATSNK